MKPIAERLSPPPWQDVPGLDAVLGGLQRIGGVTRLVGGCVRDAVIGRAIGDVDLATTLTPQGVMEGLVAEGLQVVPTGLAHGTVTVIAAHRPFEVTTLRRDVATDGRRATIVFTDDWAADAARRDFTMNALYADADGTLYDPAEGLCDLRAGRVRFIGDATARIEEDFLRVLRFFRFHAWYGVGALDVDGMMAAAAARDKLSGLSGERVQKEMLRLLAAPEPLAALAAMVENGILAALAPGPFHLERLGRAIAAERSLGLEADPLRRLAVFLSPEARIEVAARWRFSNKDAGRLSDLTKAAPVPSTTMNAKALRRVLYALGGALTSDRAILDWAGDEAGDISALRMIVERAREWERPQLSVNGGDLVAAGVPSGPRVGALLSALEAWWMDMDFVPDAAAQRAKIKELIANERGSS